MISPPVRILIRTDASLEIGTGHVMRCLTLADALRERGAETLFICRRHRGHLLEQIRARGHEVRALAPPSPSGAPTDVKPSHAAWLGVGWDEDAQETLQLAAGERADWLVVDHYALDRRWEQTVRPMCRRLMAMDDLADRPHDCDLLLDPSLGREAGRYAGLVSDGTTMLLGPQYSLLRSEFSDARAESLARRRTPELRRVLITMGGVDKDNVTCAVLEALDTSSLPPDARIVAVMGPYSPWLEKVRLRAAQMRVATQVCVGVTNMARLMALSDLAIGAGGGTSWERCCMGLPAFILSLAENQHTMAKTLQDAGAVIAVGSAAELAYRLDELLAAGAMESFLARASCDAARITDGQGAERVCRQMLK